MFSWPRRLHEFASGALEGKLCTSCGYSVGQFRDQASGGETLQVVRPFWLPVRLHSFATEAMKPRDQEIGANEQTHAYIQAYIHACIHSNMHIYTGTSVRPSVRPYVLPAYILSHLHTYTYINTLIFTYMYIYIEINSKKGKSHWMAMT